MKIFKNAVLFSLVGIMLFLVLFFAKQLDNNRRLNESLLSPNDMYESKNSTLEFDDRYISDADNYDGKADFQLTTESDSAGRFIVFSDLHYNHNPSFIADSDERMQLLVDSLNAEHAKRPIDFCIFNGDMAVGFEKESIEAFAAKWADQFEMPVFWFPGDHDDVTEGTWVSLLDNSRQASLEDDNFYFICLDVYSDACDDGLESSGIRKSTEIDSNWLVHEIAKAGNKPVILLTHYLYCDTWFPDIAKTLEKYPQIVTVISSHSHDNSMDMIDGKVPLISTGNFSYPNDGNWDNKGAENENLWGFANFEIIDDCLYHWYIQPAYNYTDIGVNLPFTEGEKHLILKFN